MFFRPQTEPQPPYRIELNLYEMNQLFNSMDPSPFNVKDLDHDAEEFIVSWAQEFPTRAPVTLRVHLERWPSEDPAKMITEAVHHYFAYRAKLNHLEFRHLMKQGRVSLGIGLIFLAACLFVSGFLPGRETRTWAGFLQEGLTIAGWVAMWRPMQIYLYDWWPLARRDRIYAKLSQMPVEVVPKK